MSERYFERSYSEFEPLVREIKTGTSTAEFIGDGAESSVWRVALDGISYAVKCTNVYSSRGRRRDVQRATEAKIEAGLRGVGIPGLEQICTASVEDGVVVYDFVNGTVLSKATEADMSKVTSEHITAFQETVFLATEARIEIDGWNSKGGNAFFSPQEGFTLIDYVARENITYKDNLTFAIRSLGQAGLGLNIYFPDRSN